MMVWTRKVVETVRSGCLLGNPLAVQWSGPLALTAKVLGSIPGEETKIPQVTWQYPTSHMVRPKKKKKGRKKKLLASEYILEDGTTGLLRSIWKVSEEESRMTS